jgi:hypothetical protein
VPENGPQVVEFELGGLVPETTYHDRVVAVAPTADRAVAGADRTFTTPAAGPLDVQALRVVHQPACGSRHGSAWRKTLPRLRPGSYAITVLSTTSETRATRA